MKVDFRLYTIGESNRGYTNKLLKMATDIVKTFLENLNEMCH